ncbi:MAG: hypothetical protein ACOYIS_02685 [Candidatus Cloacimonadaceae bacterium]|jgi:hypothetical protein
MRRNTPETNPGDEKSKKLDVEAAAIEKSPTILVGIYCHCPPPGKAGSKSIFDTKMK